MAGAPVPPSRSSSLRSSHYPDPERPGSMASEGFSIYKAVSYRPFSWNVGESARTSTMDSPVRDTGSVIRKWDGAARMSVPWDGLRKDPDLWYPEGNCFVHLYGRGQSKRGPAFRVPIEALLAAKCQPLLERFMAGSPCSETSSSGESVFFAQSSRKFDLYIPPPPAVERWQAFIYHTATRNFFAWIFGKSSVGEDNVQTIMDYIDMEGYADMRNQPEYAIAILFFAGHFRFKDLWVDALAHCAGMSERLYTSPGFENLERPSRALISHSRIEMDIRLDQCGIMLRSFLSDELSDAYLGLSKAERSHLDKFRSFLQSYYVAKLGYYPPSISGISTFPKSIYGQMTTEFQKLYDYLVDSHFTSSESIPSTAQGGICVLQSVESFDRRQKFPSLLHPLPLLPDVELPAAPQLTKRICSHFKSDKMLPDPRLVAYASLLKATNRANTSLSDCTLVRAYRGFEKDFIFSKSKAKRKEKLSQKDARKVRWILIYSILQTLLSATKIPEQVRDIHNVSYNLCIQAAGCPTWKEETPYTGLTRTKPRQAKHNSLATQKSSSESLLFQPYEIKPDIDYTAYFHRPQPRRAQTAASTPSRRGTIRHALSSFSNVPELLHPRPQRASFHEILIPSYRNVKNVVPFLRRSQTIDPKKQQWVGKFSSDSGSSSREDSSKWSNSSDGTREESPRTSLSSAIDKDPNSPNEKNSRSIRGSVDMRVISAIETVVQSRDSDIRAFHPSHLLSSSEDEKGKEREDEKEAMDVTKEMKTDGECIYEHEMADHQELQAYLAA
ncbi:hypothetical protein B7494_g5946 [Chlorociboria aeruginascens]|nr:hypothetical protein B7494_g5946 [Chlorociboria aeruginascens]